jgi:hypothetical protein
MDLQKVVTAALILVFFGIPLLYVWKVKHPSRPLWQWFVCFVVIIHGPPLLAGYFTGYLMDLTAHGLEVIFQMNHEATAVVARAILTVLAVSTIIPGVYRATNIMRRPAEKSYIVGATALYPAPVAHELNRN